MSVTLLFLSRPRGELVLLAYLVFFVFLSLTLQVNRFKKDVRNECLS